jgi:Rrf2 family protein
VKLSQGVEWGLHAASLLALAPAGQTVRRDALAGHYGLPEAYLAKHLQAMTRSGVLQATPGPRGGYRLARPAGDITVLDVVEAVDGAAKPFTCQEIRQRGVSGLSPEECRRKCRIHSVMDDADEAWRSSLRAVTVADLVNSLPSRIRRRNEKLMADAAGN